jgi:hypothetical protein
MANHSILKFICKVSDRILQISQYYVVGLIRSCILLDKDLKTIRVLIIKIQFQAMIRNVIKKGLDVYDDDDDQTFHDKQKEAPVSTENI